MYLLIASLLVFAQIGICVCADRRATHCYGDLGCFQSHYEIPLPFSPTTIATTFRLHVRNTSYVYNLAAYNLKSHISSWLPHFDASKQTKILIHGFKDTGVRPMWTTLANELLKRGDFNVIVTDWVNGSSADYFHAVANTFVVGAEIAQLVTYLHDSQGLDYADVHIIGHSLGAHTAGNAGHRIPNLGRISGMDPSGPEFTGKPVDRRLDAGDAFFVDVIHTDTSAAIAFNGLGIRASVGDVDFYPNGGEYQPGCAEQPTLGAGESLDDPSTLMKLVCNHMRSVHLFIESVNSACKFYAHTCQSGNKFEAGHCLGCPTGGCPVMGFDANQYKNASGKFYLSTSGKSPYCGHEYFVDIKMADTMLHTYGEFMMTLVGTKGESESLKLESIMHTYDQGHEEKHVISTHVDIGTVTSVKVEFIKAVSLQGSHVQNYIKVHSIVVEPAGSSQKIRFCAHEQHFSSGQTIAVSSTSGC